MGQAGPKQLLLKLELQKASPVLIDSVRHALEEELKTTKIGCAPVQSITQTQLTFMWREARPVQTRKQLRDTAMVLYLLTHHLTRIQRLG